MLPWRSDPPLDTWSAIQWKATRGSPKAGGSTCQTACRQKTAAWRCGECSRRGGERVERRGRTRGLGRWRRTKTDRRMVGPLGGRGKSAANAGMAALVLGALGVVYGDIAPSPLYAVQTVFSIDKGRIQATTGDVLGSSRWWVWSLTIIVVDQIRRRCSCGPTTRVREGS